MDKVLVPWENVFCYGDVDKANNFFPQTGFLPRALLHGCTRLAVKLDFIAGALLKAVEATGSKDFRGVQANVGEVLVWRNLFWGLSEAMVRNPKPWIGEYLLPDIEPAGAYQITSTMAYTKIKYIIEQTVASGLIYLNSSSRDFKNPAIRPYLDKYMRGSNGYDAVDRVKLLKLLWDAVGTEFAGRHELYEINYGGSTEEIRRYVLFGAQAMGIADKLKGFVEKCMSEYDLDGWKVPDLTNPGELSYHGNGHAAPPASVTPLPLGAARRTRRRAPARPCSAAAAAASATRSPPSRGVGRNRRQPYCADAPVNRRNAAIALVRPTRRARLRVHESARRRNRHAFSRRSRPVARCCAARAPQPAAAMAWRTARPRCARTGGKTRFPPGRPAGLASIAPLLDRSGCARRRCGRTG